jgi:hypothetical protein
MGYRSGLGVIVVCGTAMASPRADSPEAARGIVRTPYAPRRKDRHDDLAGVALVLVLVSLVAACHPEQPPAAHRPQVVSVAGPDAGGGVVVRDADVRHAMPDTGVATAVPQPQPGCWPGPCSSEELDEIAAMMPHRGALDAGTSSSDASVATVGRGNVRGRVWYQQVTSWCAGAAPPPGWRPQVNRGASANRRLLFRAGDKNTGMRPKAETTTGTDGAFSVTLPAGTWCIVDDSKRTMIDTKHRRDTFSAPVEDADLACLAAQRATCDSVVTVSADQRTPEVEITYTTGGCAAQQPCSRRGPVPASVPR